jgi:transcriptional regulator with XRE-family HTH domain
MTTNSKDFPPRTELTEKLTEPEYRAAFVESEIRRGLPFQIRAIREARGWNQRKLGEAAGIKQSNISRIENKRGSFLDFKTLLKLAEAFDVALVVKFVPFSELEEWVTRPLPDMVPADFQSESRDRESTETAASIDASQDFLLSMFAGRQLQLDGPDWSLFSSNKYANGMTPTTGGLDGTTRHSQGSGALFSAFRANEPDSARRASNAQISRALPLSKVS